MRWTNLRNMKAKLSTNLRFINQSELTKSEKGRQPRHLSLVYSPSPKRQIIRTSRHELYQSNGVKTLSPESMSFYNGRRLNYDGDLCTVRYFGLLEGLKGDWLGVEWDNSSRGKHTGQHKGRQIFHCLSSSPTAASFIRPSRKPDSPRTLLQAIKHKYAGPTDVKGKGQATKQDTIEISGKQVEEVGFEKIQQQISQIQILKNVLVDGMNVTGISFDDPGKLDAQAELAKSCPSITELDIGWNAIESWQDVADMITPLQRLRILKASGLRLKGFKADFLPDGTSPFHAITELHLNECLLRPDEVLPMLYSSTTPLFPSLHTLWLSANELKSLHTLSPSVQFPSVTTLVLENNKFTTLDPLTTILSLFPNTTHLSLQGNVISSIGDTLPNSFPNISFLNVADNHITSFDFIDALPTLFPNLVSLRISRNPLYDHSNLTTEPTHTTDKALTTSSTSTNSTYYLTLARISALKILNYTTITAREREEGEIYYLSVAEKSIRQLLSIQPESAFDTANKLYPLYSTLCLKYDRPNILSSNPPSPLDPEPKADLKTTQIYPPGSLGARLVHATFYIPNTHPPTTATTNPHSNPYTLTRPLPPSLPVFTLKSILSRHFGLAPLQFRLVYETTELDPVMESTTKMFQTKGEWDDWGDWDVDVVDVGDGDKAVKETGEGDGNNSVPSSATQQNEVTPSEPPGRLPTYILVNGTRYLPREIAILDGMRNWGDYLETGVKEVRIRVEPFEGGWEGQREKWLRE